MGRIDVVALAVGAQGKQLTLLATEAAAWNVIANLPVLCGGVPACLEEVGGLGVEGLGILFGRAGLDIELLDFPVFALDPEGVDVGLVAGKAVVEIFEKGRTHAGGDTLDNQRLGALCNPQCVRGVIARDNAPAQIGVGVDVELACHAVEGHHECASRLFRADDEGRVAWAQARQRRKGILHPSGGMDNGRAIIFFAQGFNHGCPCGIAGGFFRNDNHIAVFRFRRFA